MKILELLAKALILTAWAVCWFYASLWTALWFLAEYFPR